MNSDFRNYFKNEIEIPGTYCFTYIEFNRSTAIVNITNEFEVKQ